MKRRKDTAEKCITHPQKLDKCHASLNIQLYSNYWELNLDIFSKNRQIKKERDQKPERLPEDMIPSIFSVGAFKSKTKKVAEPIDKKVAEPIDNNGRRKQR